MLTPILIGASLVAVTVAIHAVGTAWWVSRLRALPRPAAGQASFGDLLKVLLRTALVLLGLHLIQVILWAFLYRLLPQINLESLEQAVYFSLVTFTTLGYGDVTIGPPWRILAAIEALNGIVLLGWSTALSFAVMQNILSDARRD